MRLITTKLSICHSVTTIPKILDLIFKGELYNHELNAGDKVIFASVGAGMHINAMVNEMV